MQEKTLRPLVRQLMQAIADDDHDTFMSIGNDAFAKAVTQQEFSRAVALYAKKIQGGYAAQYLDQITQNGNPVHLWKISYETSTDDNLAICVTANKQVTAFWLQ